MKIGDLSNYTTPADSDVLPIVDVVNNTTKKVTRANLFKNATIETPVFVNPSQTGQASGWITGLPVPDTVTYNGNRSYDLVFNSTNLTTYISPGMRLRATRNIAAGGTSAKLNGSSQYFSKTSPAGMTFTDDFAVAAQIKLAAYQDGIIASRYNGTSGWVLQVLSTGQLQMVGYNASAANYSLVKTVQAITTNEWYQIAAQLDMSAFTATTTTSYIMIDGVDVPCTVGRAGTNPTALIQAGNLEIGAGSAGTFFNGWLSQVAIFNAKVTQATMRTYFSQFFVGTETNEISAYSLSNSVSDLNANANNLTAQGSATTTNADSPFGGQADTSVSTTLEYGLVMKTAFSTNTTLTVQVPRGNALPTTAAGIIALAYSDRKAPYGMSTERGRWGIKSVFRTTVATTSNATFGAYNAAGDKLLIPTGQWLFRAEMPLQNSTTTLVEFVFSSSDPTGTAVGAWTVLEEVYQVQAAAAAANINNIGREYDISLSSPATYTLYSAGATTSAQINSAKQLHQFIAYPAYL